MVKYLRKKNSSVKVAILKSRKLDFFRINPIAIVKQGVNRLIRKGIIEKGTRYPTENFNRFITPIFVVHWAKSRFNDSNNHIGFTVSVKSTSKRANKRNLIRRRLKYSVNENIRNFNLSEYDIVFTTRHEILNASYYEINKQIIRVLKFIEINKLKKK